MFSETDYDRIAQAEVVTRDGESLGTADALYVDDTGDTPTWVTVHSGLLGMKTHFVPLRDATFEDGRLVVPFSKDEITGSPSLDESGHLTPDDEAQLFRHYGRGDFETTGDARMHRYGDVRDRVEGRDGVDDDRVPHYVESAQAGTAAAAGAAYVDARRDPEDPDLNLAGRDRDPLGRGGAFDRDGDGRGPVGEVLDGPDRGGVLDRDRDGRGPVGEVLDGPDRGGVLDRDRDGRGPVGEALDGPDTRRDYDRGYAGDTAGEARGQGDVWRAIDDMRGKLDEILRRLDRR